MAQYSFQRLQKWQTPASILLIILVAAICYASSGILGYKVVAFILLLTISLLAIVFDIIAVLSAAVLSALIWNFFFIPPRFTFHIGTAEDAFLFLMYFIIALINAVLTNRIRHIERKAREEEEKARSVELYNTLLNSLSHELRTPISAIVGASDSLLSRNKELQPSDRAELTGTISSAALRLNQQVENLLSMSRIESGYLQVQADWCDLAELVNRVIFRMEQNLNQHHVLLESDPGLPLFRVDPLMLEQVLYNLLNNAAFYTPPYTDIRIYLRVNDGSYHPLEYPGAENYVKDNDRQLLKILVEDEGPGFPEIEISRAFDKFYRLPGTRKGGTGLGLSIVKGFVTAMGGNVVLENIPHGCRFTIEIPAETSYLNQIKNE